MDVQTLYSFPLFEQAEDGSFLYAEIATAGDGTSVAYLRRERIGAYDDPKSAAEALGDREAKVRPTLDGNAWHVIARPGMEDDG